MGKTVLSCQIFGFDPHADRLALLEEGRGRRLFPAAPDESLMLKKASAAIPHGGGLRIQKGSPEYRLLREWIAEGAPEGDPTAPRVASIRVAAARAAAASRRIAAASRRRPLHRRSRGRRHRARKVPIQSRRAVGVDSLGLVTAGQTPGEAAVMAAYMNSVDVFRALVPLDAERGKSLPHASPEHNFIDRLVDQKLKRLNIVPSPLCTDEEFLRRVSLDVIGTLPTPNEVRSFLSDPRSDRRQRVVDSLLKRPEYAEYWALKWSDLLRVDRRTLGFKQAYDYYAWIRDSFAENKPYDQFVRELIYCRGVARAVSGRLRVQSRQRSRADRQHDFASLFRCADRLCPMPPSSVRPLEPDRLLRHAGVLHAGGLQVHAARRAARFDGDHADSKSPHGRDSLCASASARPNPTRSPGRRPAQAIGRLDDVARQSLAGPLPRQSCLVAFHRPWHRGAGRRFPADESAVQSGTVRRAGRRIS